MAHDRFSARNLSSDAKDVLGQLFVEGPIWDGSIISKTGLEELCVYNFARHQEYSRDAGGGWAFLTDSGVSLATFLDVSDRSDQRWHQKQGTAPRAR